MTSSSIRRLALGAVVFLTSALPAGLAAWRSDPPLEDAFATALKSQKLSNPKELMWDTERPAVETSIAGCSGRVQILAISSVMDDQHHIEGHIPPHRVRTFLYVDEVWAALDPIKVWTTYARAEAQNVVRKHPFINLDNMIEIVAPPNCRAVRALDLRAFWDTR